jgi:hypothetical protein
MNMQTRWSVLAFEILNFPVHTDLLAVSVHSQELTKKTKCNDSLDLKRPYFHSSIYLFNSSY